MFTVPDYTGAVVALAGNQIDIAWLGGVTSIKAQEQSQNNVTFVACRQKDLQFKSYFIANAEVMKTKGIEAKDNLKALAESFKKSSFTFGSKSSTSGHIMPRFFLAEAGLSPEQCFASKPNYQLKGGHSATLKAVSSGLVDLGALNYSTWDKADAETKAKAPIIFETPSYVDYCMLAHTRLGDELIGKLRTAFTKLDPNNADDAKVLEAFSASKFVAAKSKDWDGIRKVLKQLSDNKSS